MLGRSACVATIKKLRFTGGVKIQRRVAEGKYYSSDHTDIKKL